MKGAFVAYHNTEKIFGYEYIPLKEIAFRLFGNEYNLDLTYKCLNEMFYHILETISGQFPDFDQLKIGFYANNIRNSLTVFVEEMIHDQEYEILPENMTPDVQTYFRKFSTLRNPISKFEFQFQIFQNDVLVGSPDTYFQPNDSIKIKWNWTTLGKAMETDYINFLNDAYKVDSNFGIFHYGGVWTKSNDKG